MGRRRCVTSVILLLLVFLAQRSTLETTRPADPAGPQSDAPVTLTVRVADGRRYFRPGEIIPIELEFSSAIPKRFVVDGATDDRSGRLTIDEFRLDPVDAVTDPMLDYFASRGAYIGGGLGGGGVLGDQPFIVTLILNDRFRCRRACSAFSGPWLRARPSSLRYAGRSRVRRRPRDPCRIWHFDGSTSWHRTRRGR